MSNVQPLKRKGSDPITDGTTPTLADFPKVLGELALQVATHAMKLPRAQFDMKLDALKAVTAYQSMLNRASEGDEGAGIADMREQLVRPTPAMTEQPEEPEEEEPDGRAEDS